MSASATSKAQTNGSTDGSYELPWYFSLLWCRNILPQRTNNCRVEKYRPQVLDDVVGNVDTIERLKVIAREGNCPHLIISVRPWHSILNQLQCDLGIGLARNWEDDKHTLSCAP